MTPPPHRRRPAPLDPAALWSPPIGPLLGRLAVAAAAIALAAGGAYGCGDDGPGVVRPGDGGPMGDDDDDMVGGDDDDDMMGDDDDEFDCDYGTFEPAPVDPWGNGDPAICDAASPPTTCASATDCTLDELCRAGGCGGGSYCLPAGSPCSSDASCPGESVCGPDGFCVSGDPTVSCRGSWDCPAGFACEPRDGSTSDPRACLDGADCDCVDRRLPCRLGMDGDGVEVGSGCPVGYVCQRRGEAGRPWCVRRAFCNAEVPCDDGEVCLAGLCVPDSGQCTSDDGCDQEGERCSISLRTGLPSCGFDNPCLSDLDCGSVDFRCNDQLHPIGTFPDNPDEGGFCHPIDGCQSDAECPANALCGWLLGNPPEGGLPELDVCLPAATCLCFDPDGVDPALGAGGAVQPCDGT